MNIAQIVASQATLYAYFHWALTGAMACPTRELSSAYGFDRCPVCIPQGEFAKALYRGMK